MTATPKTYLGLDANGLIAEAAATVIGGTGHDGEIPALNTGGLLDLSVMPVGIGPDTVSLVTSDDLASGDLVNIYYTGTSPKVPTARKADATNGRPAHGFVLAGTSQPASASIYLAGNITGFSGLTPGHAQFLGTAGAATETPNATSGQLLQNIGVAATTATIAFLPGQAITRV